MFAGLICSSSQMPIYDRSDRDTESVGLELYHELLCLA